MFRALFSVGFLGLATPAFAGDVVVSHSTMTGGSVSAYWSDAFSGGYLDVYESSTRGRNPKSEVWLSYSRYEVDPTSEQCVTESWEDYLTGEVWENTYCYYTRSSYENGWAVVPSGDVNVGKKVAWVSTDLADAVSFDGWRCEYDSLNPDAQFCEPTQGGVIDLQWEVNGYSSSFHNGVHQETYGSYTFRSTGKYSSYSMDVGGTFFGAVLPEKAWGYGSDSSGTSVSKDVVFTQP